MKNPLFSKSAIQNRLQRSQEKLRSIVKDSECLLIRSGQPLTKPGGLDQNYGFIPHPTYYWLTGSRRPHQVALFSLATGWIHFISPTSEEEKIWEGAEDEAPLTVENRNVAELESFIKAQGLNIVSGEREFILRNTVDQVRRIKDTEEIKLIEKIARQSLEGYKKMPGFIRPGVSERDIQLEYEHAVLKAGADGMPYETIVGSGSNSAILHAIPTEKKVQENEFVLMDAGAAFADYCVDITRIFPSSGRFNSQQKDLYDLVLKAQTECIQMCQVGTLWNKVHEKAARVIAQGLIDFKIYKGSLDSMLETEAISLFFPHGVGHLVGLRVRDTGHEENKTPRKYFGARLRVDVELLEKMLITVEPGCYFIPTLLENPKTREKYKSSVDFDKAASWYKIGGIRIEDDILIESTGPRNLTEIVPKLIP